MKNGAVDAVQAKRLQKAKQYVSVAKDLMALD